ncbi:hypothetical protein ABBQ38_002086 [Trebouxia sp. C0009 RCD-2024]
MSPGPSETNTAQELVHGFSSAQRIRALKYKQLEKGFQAVLHTHNDTDYKAVMAEVTVAFQVCSETINAAEAGLRSLDQHDLADMLRVIQTNEHEKLRLTLILQALRQSFAHGQFSWTCRPSADSIETNSGSGTPTHACQCCTAAEPTEAEYSAAKAEALQGLQTVVDNINDVLEEIKYAEADLDEQ